jgi:hypothetical protein
MERLETYGYISVGISFLLLDVGVHGAVVLALVAGLFFYRAPRRAASPSVPPPQAP